MQVFCRVTGFSSDFLSFIVVEHICFLHGTIQFIFVDMTKMTRVMVTKVMTVALVASQLENDQNQIPQAVMLELSKSCWITSAMLHFRQKTPMIVKPCFHSSINRIKLDV